MLLAFKLTHFKPECEALILLMFEEIGLCANNFFAEIVPVSSAYISPPASSLKKGQVGAIDVETCWGLNG